MTAQVADAWKGSHNHFESEVVMRTQLSDSRKLTTIENGDLITRRNILMGSGLCAALLIGPPFVWKNEAYAQHPLIKALLAGIELARDIWKVLQPTDGNVTLVNRYNIVREGYIIFQVVGPKGIENLGYFSYMVPPGYQNTYKFFEGPYGTFSGQKDFTGETARGKMATRMVVEA